MTKNDVRAAMLTTIEPNILMPVPIHLIANETIAYLGLPLLLGLLSANSMTAIHSQERPPCLDVRMKQLKHFLRSSLFALPLIATDH